MTPDIIEATILWSSMQGLSILNLVHFNDFKKKWISRNCCFIVRTMVFHFSVLTKVESFFCNIKKKIRTNSFSQKNPWMCTSLCLWPRSVAWCRPSSWERLMVPDPTWHPASFSLVVKYPLYLVSSLVSDEAVRHGDHCLSTCLMILFVPFLKSLWCLSVSDWPHHRTCLLSSSRNTESDMVMNAWLSWSWEKLHISCSLLF